MKRIVTLFLAVIVACSAGSAAFAAGEDQTAEQSGIITAAASETEAATETDAAENEEKQKPKYFMNAVYDVNTGLLRCVTFQNTSNWFDPNLKIYKPSEPEFAEAYEYYKPVLEGKEPFAEGFYDCDGVYFPPEYVTDFYYGVWNRDGTPWCDREIKLLANYGETEEHIKARLKDAHKFGNQEPDPEGHNGSKETDMMIDFWEMIVNFFKKIADFFTGLFG
ncbi:MAG: hypothetical protein IKS39_03905 [Clostridia bacterium]|nr:hypothetical protein [Clostridia bacterium]